jgi:hypothetical protein
MLSRAERQAATVVLMLIVGVLLVFVYIDERHQPRLIGRADP